MKRVPYPGSTDIRSHRWQLRRHGVLVHGFHALLHTYIFGNKYKYQTNTYLNKNTLHRIQLYIQWGEDDAPKKRLRTISAGLATLGFLEVPTVHRSIPMQVATESTRCGRSKNVSLEISIADSTNTLHTYTAYPPHWCVICWTYENHINWPTYMYIHTYIYIQHEYWVIHILDIYKQRGQFFKFCDMQDGWVAGEIYSYVGFIHT